MKRELMDSTNNQDKKRKRDIVTGVDGYDSQSKLADDLMFELCTRIPIKKLFQFMYVSNVWCSTIHNPMFSQAYQSCIIVFFSSAQIEGSNSQKMLLLQHPWRL